MAELESKSRVSSWPCVTANEPLQLGWRFSCLNLVIVFHLAIWFDCPHLKHNFLPIPPCSFPNNAKQESYSQGQNQPHLFVLELLKMPSSPPGGWARQEQDPGLMPLLLAECLAHGGHPILTSWLFGEIACKKFLYSKKVKFTLLQAGYAWLAWGRKNNSLYPSKFFWLASN